jgi:hypothetical protein
LKKIQIMTKEALLKGFLAISEKSEDGAR